MSFPVRVIVEANPTGALWSKTAHIPIGIRIEAEMPFEVLYSEDDEVKETGAIHITGLVGALEEAVRLALMGGAYELNPANRELRDKAAQSSAARAVSQAAQESTDPVVHAAKAQAAVEVAQDILDEDARKDGWVAASAVRVEVGKTRWGAAYIKMIDALGTSREFIDGSKGDLDKAWMNPFSTIAKFNHELAAKMQAAAGGESPVKRDYPEIVYAYKEESYKGKDGSDKTSFKLKKIYRWAVA